MRPDSTHSFSSHRLLCLAGAHLSRMWLHLGAVFFECQCSRVPCPQPQTGMSRRSEKATETAGRSRCQQQSWALSLSDQNLTLHAPCHDGIRPSGKWKKSGHFISNEMDLTSVLTAAYPSVPGRGELSCGSRARGRPGHPHTLICSLCGRVAGGMWLQEDPTSNPHLTVDNV